MSHKIVGIPLSLCLVLNMLVAAASANVDFENVVQDKARYWQSLGRDDKATEAWRKILLSMPENQEAILWLGINSSYTGDLEAANGYLEQLQEMKANEISVNALKRAIKMGQPDAGYLKNARSLAKDKKVKEAVTQYKLAFHNVKPVGHLAAEYYQVVASLSDGWQEAHEGFKELSETFPKQYEYRYIYARHLTYKESTRREGIDLLSDLATKKAAAAVSEKAAQDWYQGLIWLQFKKGDERYFAKYLQHFPDNRIIKNKLKSLKRLVEGPSERDNRLQQAYQMMEDGDLDGAKEQFDYLLEKDGDDAEALAGRAILDLKRERFASAVTGLEKAIEIEPEYRNEWQPPLTEARFWLMINQAKQARKQSELAKAEEIARRANKILPGNIYGHITLADILMDKGELSSARQVYSDLSVKYPENVDIKIGLANVLAALGERQATFSVLDEIETMAPEKLASIAQLRTQFLVEEFLDTDNEKQRRQVLQMLEKQLDVAPTNPWVRLDIARVYRAQGALEKARSLLDGLLTTHSDMPAVLYAKALFFEQDGKNIEGMLLLEKIPLAKRDADMRRLQHRLWVKAQTARALALANYGQIELAHEVLEKVAPVVEHENELIGILASAWSDMGNSERALQLLRRAAANGNLDLKLNYAAILLQSGQDVEGELVIKQLLEQKLSRSQQKRLADLVIGHSIRRANEAREKGDFALAYDYLAPVMFQYGSDDRIVLSMASLFASADENDRALELYRRVLSRNTNDMNALQGAVGVAIKAAEYDIAEEMLAFGMAQHKDNSRLFTLRGQLAKAQGNDKEALSYFNRALELERRKPSSHSMGNHLHDDLPLQLIDYQETDSINGYRYSNPFRSSLENRAPFGTTNSRVTFRPIERFDSNINSDHFIKTGSSDSINTGTDKTATDITNIVKPAILPPQWQRPMSGQELIINREIQAIESKYSSHGGVGIALRNRSGENGLDQLVDFELPLSFTFSPGYHGLLQFKAVPVLLDAGNLKLSDKEQLNRFGSYALNRPAITHGTVAQDDSGIALGLGYRTNGWYFELGSTPLGFTRATAVGAIGWTPGFGDFNLNIGLLRQSLVDSLLSYAGAKDQITGRSWGGITENGFRFATDYQLQSFQIYGDLKLARVIGENVASNNKFELNAGFYTAMVATQAHEVSIGINFNALGFSENLSKFTYGHGGYFSPRNYLSISVPVKLSGREGRLGYRLGGSIGIQSFREDDSDYYPNDDAMQQRLEQLALLDPSVVTFYEGKSVTGINFSLQAGAEYALTPTMALGTRVTFANAKDYDEFSGKVYLRIWAEPQQQRLNSFHSVNPFYEGGL